MIIRCNHGSSVNVDKELIFNKELSVEAKFILIILLSHDDNYKFTLEELVKESRLSKYKVEKALKELKERKYIQYKHVSTSTGRFDGVEWIIKENPNGTVITKNEQPTVVSANDFNFNRIWEAYPTHRRGDKKEARKAFNRISDVNNIIEDIMRGLNEMKDRQDWRKEEGRWVPGLKKFLENRIWEDGLNNPTSAQAFKAKMMEAYNDAKI